MTDACSRPNYRERGRLFFSPRDMPSTLIVKTRETSSSVWVDPRDDVFPLDRVTDPSESRRMTRGDSEGFLKSANILIIIRSG